ncbi:MAG: PVC-type heme-binding CxxCH protein [Gemmataceae bacterium]
MPFRFLTLIAMAFFLCLAPVSAQKQFGFDNRKPSGQPYLKPEESLQKMRVADGFEVKLFAAEPDVINPIAFTVDERGRLWVVECFEYPKRTPKGQKPRDRIKILEDTNGDGKCDKVTIWAEGKDLPIGFDMASGIEVGHGGVFLGAPPYLFFLQDTTGDGKCDKQEILLKGFGSQDTHETLNTFHWGPDGRLYGLHGIFTQSDVAGVRLNAAVWRYDVKTKQFEVFAEGTSNPWGMDFDDRGNSFLCCCVIPHLFHISQGGVYRRQAGASFNPYAYGLLNEICDHTFHRESGWAHAGLIYLQGPHIPKEYQGSVIFGSIHGCSIKRNTLKRNGSTFTGSRADDFLVSGDKNFRPINLRWAHDGGIYLIDWHDQNPCHQAHPDSWDKEHGRIYKIQPKGLQEGPAPNLGNWSSTELAEELGKKDSHPWRWRTALRLLAERKGLNQNAEVVGELLAGNFANRRNDESMTLRSLWGFHAVGIFENDFLPHLEFLPSSHPAVRAWAVRLLGDRGQVSDKVLARLVDMAANDPAPAVRLQLAGTAQRLTKQDTLPLLHHLMRHQEDAKDPCLPLMIWLAYEPRLADQGAARLEWLKENAPGNPLVTNDIVPRVMRRLIATGKPADLAACVSFVGAVNDNAVRRQALEGVTLALQNRQVNPPAAWRQVRVALLKSDDAEIRRLAQRLAVNLGDAETVKQALAVACDISKPVSERIEALRDVALAHPEEAFPKLRQLVLRDKELAVRCEACRALAAYAEPDLAAALLAGWKDYPLALQQEVVQLLASRKEWAGPLLAAVGQKHVPRAALTDNTILRIRAFKDATLNQQIETVWGKVRDTPAELAALIDKMRSTLHTQPASFERGRKVFDAQCAKCHKFEGRGFTVGPELDGAARDIDYLLVNVLDPNRVIGQPYFQRTVLLKNGRVEVGLLHAEDEQFLTLKGENDVLKVIAKKDIDEAVTQEKSIMPEGLSNAMTAQDFADLIRYVMAHPFLTDVTIAGPLSAAEAKRLVADTPPGAHDTIWTRPQVGVTGRIPIPGHQAGKSDVALVAADVHAVADLKTHLLLGAAHPLEVWLNGQKVYQGQPGTSPAEPDQAAVDVTLRKGVNHLLIQVACQETRGTLHARFHDPHRKLKPER